MDTSFVGIYWIFTRLPVWVVACVLYASTELVVYLIRDRLEGLGYQVAYSAKIGDAALICIVIMVAEMFHDGRQVHIPLWLSHAWVHVAVIAGAFVLGLIVDYFTVNVRSGAAADVYHDIVIAPFILYCAFTLLPVILYNATVSEKWFTAAAILLWLGLVFFDIHAGRMDQASWLSRHGFVLPRMQ